MNYFYFGPDGKVVGPITAEQIAELLHDGTLTDETLVREEGPNSKWRPLNDVHLSTDDS